MRLRWLRRTGWLGVVVIIAWLLSMTLRPDGGKHSIHLIPFSKKLPALICLATGCPDARTSFWFLFIDVLGNLAVFLPFGAALTVATLPSRPEEHMRHHVARRRWLGIVAAGFLLSLSIELAQLWVPGRTTDVDDLILNTLGTAAGAGLMQTAILIVRKVKHS